MTYRVAWNILEKSYDDPTFVINNHVKSFVELPNYFNTTAAALGELANSVTKHYRALKALKKPFLEFFPMYAVVAKLDPQTRIKWKEHIQSNNSPNMEELIEFLYSREKILETNKSFSKSEKLEKPTPKHGSQSCSEHSKNTHSKMKKQFTNHTNNRAFCHICKEAHFTQNCEKITKASLSARLELVKNLKLCSNCLRSNHTAENCNASTCKNCYKTHHTLLHDDLASKPGKFTKACLRSSPAFYRYHIHCRQKVEILMHVKLYLTMVFKSTS